MNRKTIPAVRFWRWENGMIRSCRGELSLADRGFRYGQHVFESIAVRGGAVLLGAEHLRLLTESARRHGIPCSRELLGSLRSFLASAKLGDGILRIYLTAGTGAPGSPVVLPGFHLAWEACPFPLREDLERGYALSMLKKTVAGPGWGQKNGNYALHLSALQEARESGCDEGVVRDARGRIVSCAMGNLLVWLPMAKHGEGTVLCTPSHDCGPRPGAVLGWVKRRAGAVERDLRASDLRRAVALAVTNSRIGVMPVASLDGRKLPRTALALALAQRYLSRHGLHGTP